MRDWLKANWGQHWGSALAVVLWLGWTVATIAGATSANRVPFDRALVGAVLFGLIFTPIKVGTEIARRNRKDGYGAFDDSDLHSIALSAVAGAVALPLAILAVLLFFAAICFVLGG